eukprot:6177037-Pleurochrysis_carterae.AAC.2
MVCQGTGLQLPAKRVFAAVAGGLGDFMEAAVEVAPKEGATMFEGGDQICACVLLRHCLPAAWKLVKVFQRSLSCSYCASLFWQPVFWNAVK